MELRRYVDDVDRQLIATAETSGPEARVLVERLLATLEPALRLALLDALGDATAEITRELAPGSVELRLRGREPEFVVSLPPEPAPATDEAAADEVAGPASEPVDAGDTELARINLRLPTPLKARVEQAAGAEGVSTNAWLVRAAAAAVERGAAKAVRDQRVSRGTQRYTGWVR
jgi:hypothetical protein